MKLEALQNPNVFWRENNTLVSTEFDDVYYSTDGALAEIDYVFIQHNQLPSRFTQTDDFCIAETGFGTGLNFIRSASLWLQQTHVGQMHFISFEKYPLEVQQIQQAHQSFQDNPGFPEISELLIQHYPYRLPGWHTLELIPNRLKLTLWFGDVMQGLPEVEFKIDAWFLDGFTPARNPLMWQSGLFTQMARLSHATTTFATFTANGDVRRGLKAAGFEVLKDVGFGVKREMLYGRLLNSRAFTSKAPWFVRPKESFPQKKALVVGAGLAGATAAYALAQRGWQVTVLERHAQVAQEASSNLAGTLHPLITSDWNLRSQWYLKGYETTLKWLKPWLADHQIEGKLDGLIQLAATPTAEQRMLDSLRRVHLPPDFALWQTAEQLSERLNQLVNTPGFFFPQGGWIYPKSVVQHCLKHPNIQVKTHCEVLNFEYQSGNWQLFTEQQTFTAPVAIFATAGLNARLNQKLDLPVRPVKGQVTHLSAEHVSQPLRYPLTHQGYSVSLPNQHLCGATFEAPNMETTLTASAQQENIAMTASALPHWISETDLPILGNIGFRPTAPDHLPMIGPVADADYMQTHYLSQSHTHVVYRYPEQRYLPGLYVTNGHGARGLMSVFLAAETLSNLIAEQALDMPMALYHASHPARFKIRAWRSGELATSK